MIRRIARLIRRNVAAAELAVAYGRAATFALPDSIVMNGERRALKLPAENGVRVAFLELLLDDCYGCRSLAKSDMPARTILDIGANVGLFGIAARCSFPEAQIHAYEPNRRLEPYLRNQAEVAHFRYFMEAVGSSTGRVSLHDNIDSVQARSHADDAGDVEQVALREAIARLGGSVDFAKVDCEGAEWDLFEDVESWQHIKNVSLEYHLWPNHTANEVLDRIAALGFKVDKHTPLNGYGLILARRI